MRSEFLNIRKIRCEKLLKKYVAEHSGICRHNKAGDWALCWANLLIHVRGVSLSYWPHGNWKTKLEHVRDLKLDEFNLEYAIAVFNHFSKRFIVAKEAKETQFVQSIWVGPFCLEWTEKQITEEDVGIFPSEFSKPREFNHKNEFPMGSWKLKGVHVQTWKFHIILFGFSE